MTMIYVSVPLYPISGVFFLWFELLYRLHGSKKGACRIYLPRQRARYERGKEVISTDRKACCPVFLPADTFPLLR